MGFPAPYRGKPIRGKVAHGVNYPDVGRLHLYDDALGLLVAAMHERVDHQLLERQLVVRVDGVGDRTLETEGPVDLPEGLHDVVQLPPEVALEDPLLLAPHPHDDLSRAHEVVRPTGDQQAAGRRKPDAPVPAHREVQIHEALDHPLALDRSGDRHIHTPAVGDEVVTHAGPVTVVQGRTVHGTHVRGGGRRWGVVAPRPRGRKASRGRAPLPQLHDSPHHLVETAYGDHLKVAADGVRELANHRMQSCRVRIAQGAPVDAVAVPVGLGSLFEEQVTHHRGFRAVRARREGHISAGVRHSLDPPQCHHNCVAVHGVQWRPLCAPALPLALSHQLPVRMEFWEIHIQDPA